MASRALSAQTLVSQRQHRAQIIGGHRQSLTATYLCFALFTGKTGCRDLPRLRNRPCWTSWRGSSPLAVRNKRSKHLTPKNNIRVPAGQRRATGVVVLWVLTVQL